MNDSEPGRMHACAGEVGGFRCSGLDSALLPSRLRTSRVVCGTLSRPPGASGCACLRGACCASDKLAHVLAKGRSLKRRDLFTIHPQQGRLVRADQLFRGSPFFGSLLRHRARQPPCPCARSVALLDMHMRPSQAPFFVLRNNFPHPLTCCSQHPRAYLGSCVGAGKGLDQPVRDAHRGAGRLIFL